MGDWKNGFYVCSGMTIFMCVVCLNKMVIMFLC